MAHLTTIEPAKPSSFDTCNPPSKELIQDCVHCGFCLPACPTYVLWNEEMDSPRGRIYMMDKALTGDAPLDQNFRLHMDQCLGCMACMTACPSGVQYNQLIENTRVQVERHIPRTLPDRLFRSLLFATFPHPNRLKLLAIPLWIYQRSGLQFLVRNSQILKLLPKRLAAMESLLPRVASLKNPQLPTNTARTPTRLRVGVLTGCVQSVFFNHVNAATIRVLAAEGCEVITPANQSCCGALMVHSGLDEQAKAMARQTIQAFENAGVTVVAINAAGCGSTMKEYAHLLHDDPEFAQRAASFSLKCKDISEILADLPQQAPRHPLPLRVAYHDACHLRHAQAISLQPRDLLAKIPGLIVEEIAEPALCCGSAGVYNLLQPVPAEQLGDRKVLNLLALDTQAVVSANPGCLLQLSAGLRRAGHPQLPALHMVELLDASIRNLTPDQLLAQSH